jgi:hypothetical protein
LPTHSPFSEQAISRPLRAHLAMTRSITTKTVSKSIRMLKSSTQTRQMIVPIGVEEFSLEQQRWASNCDFVGRFHWPITSKSLGSKPDQWRKMNGRERVSPAAALKSTSSLAATGDEHSPPVFTADHRY